MGTALAKREETPPVPNTPTNKRELIRELRKYSTTLDVENKLMAYGAALNETGGALPGDAHYYLLQLDTLNKTVNVKGFSYAQLQEAQAEYTEVERASTGKAGHDAVLVSVDALASLRRAYPNYFLDTGNFTEALREAIGG